MTNLFYRIIPLWLLRRIATASIIKAHESRIRFLEAELEEQGHQLDHAITMWKWHRDRGNRMHRRAQQRESQLHHEVYEPLVEEMREHYNVIRTLGSKLAFAELRLHECYPHLHTAWLHKMASSPGPQDTRTANAISELEANIRAAYPEFTRPIPPESFSTGTSDG